MLEHIPNGYLEVVETFGDPAGKGFTHNLILVHFPYPLLYMGSKVTHGTFHKLIEENVVGALELIQARGLEDEFKNYAGSYIYRPKRGSSHLSMHAFGIALDGDAEKYPPGSDARYPDAVIECFKEFGWFYGGDFEGRKDGMHFQMARGC